MQLNVLRLEIEMDYLLFKTTKAGWTQSQPDDKPSSPATSLSVSRHVGTSQSGGWMSIGIIREVIFSTSKFGGHHAPTVDDSTGTARSRSE